MPSTKQTAEAIRELIPHHDAIMVRQHGSITVGRNLHRTFRS
jgi:ribulose-5-phosphate 4-epimerase/fuculose-1-phosphate aldolase